MDLSVRALVGVTGAAGAALVILGYLTFTTAATQRGEIAAVDRANVDAITRRITDYGLTNGSWNGVQRFADSLSDDADTRIRLSTEAGATLVDTDGPVDKGSPPAAATAVRINPRPEFVLINGQQIDGPMIALLGVRTFRRDAALATCLTRAGIRVDVQPGANGVPRLVAAADAPATAVQQVTSQCPEATAPPDVLAADITAIYKCVDTSTLKVASACLGRTFTERTATVTADPVLLHLDKGRRGGLPITPQVTLLASIMILAATATALAGRALFRTIADASRRVVEGADDQVAEMSRYVDDMALSVHQNEELQRQRIAAVAHELRTPLANIRAYLEGLSDGVIQPQPELFASLHDEAMLQQRIIDDLRGDTAQTGGRTVEVVKLDFTELVKSACAAQRPAAEAAGIRLSLDVGGPLPVTGDADRLRQVLGNLLSNALRYTPAGGAVEVRTAEEEGRASLQVIDTGIGIAEEDLPRVFERDWRSEQARALVADGSGIGLSIARKFVHDHGGAIFVDSRPGMGTAFTVVLPLVTTGAARSSTDQRSADEWAAGEWAAGEWAAGEPAGRGEGRRWTGADS